MLSEIHVTVAAKPALPYKGVVTQFATGEVCHLVLGARA
jgi:hypothetical protein